MLAEQNLQSALRVGDYYYIVDDGKTVFSGAQKELQDNEDLQIRFLGVDRE